MLPTQLPQTGKSADIFVGSGGVSFNVVSDKEVWQDSTANSDG